MSSIGAKRVAVALFGTFKWTLCGVGVAALVLAIMIATPLVAPPELHSISAVRGTVDMSTLPAIERFQASNQALARFLLPRRQCFKAAQRLKEFGSDAIAGPFEQ